MDTRSGEAREQGDTFGRKESCAWCRSYVLMQKYYINADQTQLEITSVLCTRIEFRTTIYLESRETLGLIKEYEGLS